MSIISPTNKSPKNGIAKKRWLLILSLFIIFFNLIFFIWLFTGEKNSYYDDKDGDGFGNLAEIKKSKIKPWGYVSNYDDTDDNNPCIPDSTSAACLGQNPPPPPDSPPGQDIGPGKDPKNPKSCPTLNKNIGDPCTDNDDDTLNDKIDSNCICIGEKKDVKKKIFFYDGDGDGFGDPKGVKEFAADVKPSDYVSNDKDACPTRKGPASNNGCPEFQISLPSEAFINENFEAKIVGDALMPNDKVNWQNGSEIKGTILAKDFSGMSSEVGKYNIAAEIINPDGFQMTVPKATIHLKIKPTVLSDMFKPLYVYGAALSSKPSNLAVLKSKSDEAKANLKKQVKDAVLSEVTVFNKTGGIEGDLETYISADIIGGTVKGPLNISKVVYSKGTGKISEIHLK